MAGPGERADSFSQWTTTALRYHIQVGEEALAKAQAMGDEDRIEMIRSVLNAQEVALGLKIKDDETRPKREERRASPKGPRRDSIMDMIEQQFGSTRLDDRPDRSSTTPGRYLGEDGYTNVEAEKRRRAKVQRAQMQARVEDIEADEPDQCAERATPREKQGSSKGEQEDRAPDGPRQKETPTAQPRRRESVANPATPKKGDAPPSLEKRQGGTYHHRPAAEFAREELRPRSAPRFSGSADRENHHEASNGKRSARREAHRGDAPLPSPADRDPFANFPLHIRPIFTTTYRAP